MDTDTSEPRLTLCNDPIPTFEGMPFSLTCYAAGKFDTADIRWYYNNDLIEAGNEFCNHPSTDDILDWIYLVNGRLHVTKAPKSSKSLSFACEILDDRSENHNITIQPVNGTIPWKTSCFIPNLMEFMPGNAVWEQREEWDQTVMKLYDSTEQGSRTRVISSYTSNSAALNYI